MTATSPTARRRPPRRTSTRARSKIEKEFEDYFDSVGVATEPTAFDGRSDYKPFQDNGVAAGGLFSGAEVAKTAAQARSGAGPPA